MESTFSLAEQLSPEVLTEVVVTTPIWSSEPFLALYGIPVMTVLLPLLVSTVFMTIAWYAHLKYRLPMVLAVIIGWLIALAEYALSIPAIRSGYEAGLSLLQLKAVHEVLGIITFVIFARIYLKERLCWPHIVGFSLMAAGLYLVFGI